MPIKSRWTGSGFAPAQAQFGVGSVAPNLTAIAGGQAAALLLGDDVNIVTTAAASTGVRLPDSTLAQPGDILRVVNYGANALSVFPPTGGRINNGTVNTANSLAINTGRTYCCLDGTNWASV